MNAALRLVVVDDHALVRAGMRSLLETIAGVEVVGEAGDGRDALRLVGQLRPDIVLMDVSMPTLNGIDGARRVAREHPGVRILMVSMHADEQYVSEALEAGAAGYLLKSAERDELETALRTVHAGERWLSRALRTKPLDAFARGEHLQSLRPPLTPRQREVLQLIAEGNSTREIAEQLYISVKTVETHRTQLMERLDIHDVAHLVLYAIRAGIVRPDA